MYSSRITKELLYRLFNAGMITILVPEFHVKIK